MYLGTWQIDDTLTFYLNTITYSTGAATDASSAPTYRVYEDETTTPLLTGTMALLDGSNTAGFYSEQIAVSVANGFEVGKQYAIYLEWAVAAVTHAAHHTLQIEAPATITAVGAPVNTTAASATITTGSQSSGTYASTFASDNTRHTIVDSGGTLDMYYQFSVGGDGAANTVVWEGYVSGVGDAIGSYLYDWANTAWQQVGLIDGKNQATDDTFQWSVTTAHTGTGVNLGLVRVRFYGTGLTSAALNTDRLLVGYAVVNRSVGYVDGAIWIDTVNGTAGTETYVNCTADHPGSLLADGRTVALALGLRNYRIIGGSTITLANSYTAALFTGSGWILALGGQAVNNCTFVGAHVSGICTGTDPAFLLCHMGNCTLPPCDIGQCHLEGTITIGSAGSYSIMRSMDNTGTSSTPIIDFGAALGATDVSLRKYAGGIEIRNMKTGDYLSADGMGRLILAASCTGGEVRVRGAWDLENYSSGITLIDGARWNEDQSIATVNTGAGTITYTYTVTDSVTSDPIDGVAVWCTTDSGGSNVVASGTTDAFGQVVFQLDAGTYYFWQSLAGYDFTNPVTKVVS